MGGFRRGEYLGCGESDLKTSPTSFIAGRKQKSHNGGGQDFSYVSGGRRAHEVWVVNSRRLISSMGMGMVFGGVLFIRGKFWLFWLFGPLVLSIWLVHFELGALFENSVVFWFFFWYRVSGGEGELGLLERGP